MKFEITFEQIKLEGSRALVGFRVDGLDDQPMPVILRLPMEGGLDHLRDRAWRELADRLERLSAQARQKIRS